MDSNFGHSGFRAGGGGGGHPNDESNDIVVSFTEKLHRRVLEIPSAFSHHHENEEKTPESEDDLSDAEMLEHVLGTTANSCQEPISKSLATTQYAGLHEIHTQHTQVVANNTSAQQEVEQIESQPLPEAKKIRSDQKRNSADVDLTAEDYNDFVDDCKDDCKDDSKDEAILEDAPDDVIRIKPKDVDSDIAKHLSKLSTQDRLSIYHDVHGVNDKFKESPELIEISLQKLRKRLETIKDRAEFELAKSINPDYTLDRDFLLKFLRAERFHIRKAAIRVTLHFKAKLKLFGEALLTRDIVQDDLTEDDMAVLHYGAPSVLPARDNSGRIVCVWVIRSKIQSMQTQPKLRSSFYVAQVLSEDIAIQKFGCVCVVYAVGNRSKKRDIQAEWKLSGLSKAIPLRSEAQHFCYDSLSQLLMAAVLKIGSSLYSQARFRSHYGKQKDVLYSLQTFGIPTNLMPLDDNDQVTHEENIAMWDARRIFEGTRAKKQTPEMVPGRHDVLMGRGRTLQEHIGNVNLRCMIQELSDQYQAAKKKDKTSITNQLVSLVKERGGRFLKKEEAGWFVVDDGKARLKVSHGFRDLPSIRPLRVRHRCKKNDEFSTKRSRRDT